MYLLCSVNFYTVRQAYNMLKLGEIEKYNTSIKLQLNIIVIVPFADGRRKKRNVHLTLHDKFIISNNSRFRFTIYTYCYRQPLVNNTNLQAESICILYVFSLCSIEEEEGGRSQLTVLLIVEWSAVYYRMCQTSRCCSTCHVTMEEVKQTISRSQRRAADEFFSIQLQ